MPGYLSDALQPGDDPFAGMSPVDAFKLRQELAARQTVTPEQRAKNLKQTGWEALSVIPGPANAISAKDAWDSGKDAVQAFGAGDWRRGALASALAGLSGFGAVTGLPTSRMAGAVAKDAGRTVFSGAGSVAKIDRPIYMINDTHPSKLYEVKEAMQHHGPPQISVVDMGDHYMALEGSHRLMAAKELGLLPELTIHQRGDRINPHDFDWGRNPLTDYLHEDGLTAGDIAEILRDTSQNTKVQF
jgi:hypothetical protein